MALASIYDQRIELRRASRLVVVGDVKLPRVTTNIDFAGPPTRASIEIAPAAAVMVSTGSGRVLVRVDADALDFSPATGGGLVQLIRQGEQPNQIVVMLTDAAGPARSTVTTANNIARVLIEVPAASTFESRTPSPEPRVPSPDAAAPAPDPRAVIVATRSWQTIVIDPGHGGDDVGVRGAKGVEEKQLTLDIARRLRTMVENRLGLARDSDARGRPRHWAR